MKITIEKNLIKVDGVKKATFDSEQDGAKDLKTFNGGNAIKSDLVRALMDHKTYGWDQQDLSDEDIQKAANVWELVPEAPSPRDPSLGQNCPVVSRYVEANRPDVFEVVYPNGHYDYDMAGCGENLTEFRGLATGDLSVTPESLKKVKARTIGKIESAKRILELQEDRS